MDDATVIRVFRTLAAVQVQVIDKVQKMKRMVGGLRGHASKMWLGPSSSHADALSEMMLVRRSSERSR